MEHATGSGYPSIFVLSAHLQPEEVHDLEEQIPTLTYDAREADVILSKVSKSERIKFELRKLKMNTTPLAGSVSTLPGQNRNRGIVQVVKAAWLVDSVRQGRPLPVEHYLLYQGTRLSASKDTTISKFTGSEPKVHRKRADLHQSRPPLIHESTSEHEKVLPAIPDYLLTTYSCQRATFAHTPNFDFVEQMKHVRTVRQLQGDHIGVRAYSTSIATIAAYPHKLQVAPEVARLPGCGAKIAVLFEQWKENGVLEEVREAEHDPKLSVLRQFYDIWGVGDTTARKFYDNGWRDRDDLTEFGWSTLSRVQQIGVKFYDDLLLKIPRDEVASIAAVIENQVQEIDKGFQVMVVGGYRRGKAQSGDVDVLISHPDESQTLWLINGLTKELEKSKYIKYTLTLSDRNSQRDQKPLAWNGESAGTGFDTLDKALLVWWDPDDHSKPVRRVDIIVSPWRTVGCAILGWSGENTFQRDLRRYCKNEKSLKFDSSGIRSRVDGSWVDLENLPGEGPAPDMETAERRVFKGLGLEYRRPDERCTG